MKNSFSGRVLFLSIDGMTDSLGQSQVLPYLTGLSALGWKITLISAEKAERFESYQTHIEELCKSAEIHWIPFPYKTKPPILAGFLNVWKMGQLARKSHLKNPFKLVHCRSYLPALVGMMMKRKFQIPFIFDIRGFWVDEKIDGGIWRKTNPIHRLLTAYFKRMEKSLFNRADMIISLTEKAVPEILNLSGGTIDRKKIEVIPCCVDTTHFDPSKNLNQERSILRKHLGVGENTPLLVYLGSLSTWYLPKQMFGFYKVMRTRIPDLQFLIITNENPEPFKKLITDSGLSAHHVIFVSAQRKELPALLSLARYSVCFYNTSFSRIATSPTKLAELMSMGIPVVCSNQVGDVDEILTKTSAGTVCDVEDPQSLAKAADEIIRIVDKNQATSIRYWAITLFDLKIGVGKYDQVYQKLIS